MKKTLSLILGILVCGNAMADAPEIENIYDAQPINWRAFEYAVNKVEDTPYFQEDFQKKDCGTHAKGILRLCFINNFGDKKQASLTDIYSTVQDCASNMDEKCRPHTGYANDWSINFINDYIDYMAKSYTEQSTYSVNFENACMVANNFGDKVRYEGWELDFMGCMQYLNDTNSDGSQQLYTADSLVGQCRQWLYAAKKCQHVLINLYTEIPSMSEQDKKMYQCVRQKLYSGQITFPLDQNELEKSCR